MQEKVKRPPKIYCNISDTQYEIVSQIARTFKWRLSYAEEDDWSDLIWTDNAVTPERFSKLKLYQKINHFPGMNILSRKNSLAVTLTRLQRLLPDDFNFFPKTWLLPSDQTDLKNSNRRAYIVKPEASSQGRGIYIVRRAEDIDFSEKVVVQEYIADPLLMEGLKFDLRIYVTVTGCDPLRVFIHDSGLTRLATEEYTAPSNTNIDDVCMHLTNYAVNKCNSKFVFNNDPSVADTGHKRSLASTYAFLENHGYDVQKLKKEIDDIIVKTLIAGHKNLTHLYKCSQPEDVSRSMCFEILGFDILIDSSLKPWLLEVNHSPSFSTDTPLDLRIKEQVITDSLKLVNIKARHRKQFFANKKIDLLQKAIQPKTSKDLKIERLEAYGKIQEMRTTWENRHMSGFRRLLPSEKYEEIFKAATHIWNDWGGKANKTKEVPENPPPKKPPVRRPKPPVFNYRKPEDEGPHTETKRTYLPPATRIYFNMTDTPEVKNYSLNSLGLIDRNRPIQRTSPYRNQSVEPFTTNDAFVPGTYVVPKNFGFYPKESRTLIRPITEIKKPQMCILHLKKHFY